jgi:hypothetical protein
MLQEVRGVRRGVRVRTPNENFVFVQLEIGNQKSSCETFLILTFSDAHVIGKLMPAALPRARASHIAACRDIEAHPRIF